MPHVYLGSVSGFVCGVGFCGTLAEIISFFSFCCLVLLVHSFWLACFGLLVVVCGCGTGQEKGGGGCQDETRCWVLGYQTCFLFSFFLIKKFWLG